MSVWSEYMFDKRIKMVNFELGNEMQKVIDQQDTSVGQRIKI